MPKCRVQVCSSTEMHFSESFGDMWGGKQNKKYKCDQCEKGYRSKRYLNLHKAADHPEEGADVKQVPCDYLSCEKIYKSPDALRIHKKVTIYIDIHTD